MSHVHLEALNMIKIRVKDLRALDSDEFFMCYRRTQEWLHSIVNTLDIVIVFITIYSRGFPSEETPKKAETAYDSSSFLLFNSRCGRLHTLLEMKRKISECSDDD